MKKFDATVPRDKVYALINFVAFRRDYPEVFPDYQKLPREIYVNVTVASIATKGI